VNGRHRKINAAAVWENQTLVPEIVAILATNGTSRRAIVPVEQVNPWGECANAACVRWNRPDARAIAPEPASIHAVPRLVVRARRVESRIRGVAHGAGV